MSIPQTEIEQIAQLNNQYSRQLCSQSDWRRDYLCYHNPEADRLDNLSRYYRHEYQRWFAREIRETDDMDYADACRTRAESMLARHLELEQILTALDDDDLTYVPLVNETADDDL